MVSTLISSRLINQQIIQSNPPSKVYELSLILSKDTGGDGGSARQAMVTVEIDVGVSFP